MNNPLEVKPDEGNGLVFRFDRTGVPGERDIHIKFGMLKKKVRDMFLEWFFNLPEADRLVLLGALNEREYDEE